MNRYQLEPYRDFAQPFYAGRDPAHNFRHIERILARLSRLSEGLEPAPCLDRLYFLACFHGLGKRLNAEPLLIEQVRDFLAGLACSETEIDDLLQSLNRHLSNPQTLEEKIVYDANYLEILGAFGIAKAFTTGGSRGQLIEETVDIFEHQYLDKVEFQTPAGKRLADEGRAYAKAFLQRLRAEW